MDNSISGSAEAPVRRLGILLTTTPENENTHSVIKLTEEALAQGVEVHIFVMCDGVHNLNHSGFLSLAGKGANLAACAHNAIERSVAQREEVLWGSQYDLAEMVSECDRFLSFN